MLLNGDWGLGIGDWGLGIGPNPQSPIPNPHSKAINFLLFIYILPIIKIKIKRKKLKPFINYY
jgi:hypothetical protein